MTRKIRLIILLLIISGCTWGLRDVRIVVPPDIRHGEDAALQCLFDLEGDSLYSVKWYKGQHEFYRYTPKEDPSMKVFPLQGLKVDQRRSNWSQVVLRRVVPSLSGRYSCEVSADAPSFHTALVSADMTVVDLPAKQPIISGIKPRYKIGEVLHGNCSSHSSRPAANLTWIINGHMAKSNQLLRYARQREPHDRETARLGLRFPVEARHFTSGRLKIRCSASIGNLYWQSTEKSVEEDRPRLPLPTPPPPPTSLQDDFGDVSRRWPPAAELFPAEDEPAQVATIAASSGADNNKPSFVTSSLTLLTLLLIWR